MTRRLLELRRSRMLAALIVLALLAVLAVFRGPAAHADTVSVAGGGCTALTSSGQAVHFRGDVERIIHPGGSVDFNNEDTWTDYSVQPVITAWVSWDGSASHPGYAPVAEGPVGTWAFPETEYGPGGPFDFTYLDHAYVKWTWSPDGRYGHPCSLWIDAGGHVSVQNA